MTTPQQKAAAAYLVIRQGGRWSDVFRLQTDQSIIIGRSSSCAIVVPDDRTSRQHAEIFYAEGSWKVRDLGSRNGTLVDGQAIDRAHSLKTGETIQVANCRVSFVDSIADAFQSPSSSSSLSDEGNHDQATQEIDRPATITHRSQIEDWSTKLVFSIAQQSTWQEACEVALLELIEHLAIQAGGILGVSEGDSSTPRGLSILAARERPGKAYHRISDFLAKTVLQDRKAVIARNVQDDHEISDPQHSRSLTTSSVLCVPIVTGEKVIGLIHLYSRDDETMLTPRHLEVAVSAAQMLAVAQEQLDRQRRLRKKLNASQQQIQRLKVQLSDHQTQFEMIGDSPRMQKLISQLDRVARSNAGVLLRGESGSGKELAARHIHRESQRADGPFIAINCGALTPSLLESELFGHERGSFTGATERKLGKFELADGGTLMLDEVGEMPPEIQVKFLRVLEGQAFERVGGSKPIRVDVRVVSATNRDLEAAVKEGKFRSDLYFRLRVVEISLPSLRERPEDILPLARHFLDTFRRQSGHGPTGFSPSAEAAIQAYTWPGNIRELRNSVERAHVLASGSIAEPDDLALSHLELNRPTVEKREACILPTFTERSLDEVERDHILATLEHTRGQKSRAAAILGIERSTLDRKLKRFEDDERPN